MEQNIIDHFSGIFSNLEVPFSYKKETKFFSFLIKEENRAFQTGVWHRKHINTINFYSILVRDLTEADVHSLAYLLLKENEDLLFGSLGCYERESKYWISFQYSFILERNEGTLVSETEVAQYFKYLTYILPIMSQKVEEWLGRKVNV